MLKDISLINVRQTLQIVPETYFSDIFVQNSVFNTACFAREKRKEEIKKLHRATMINQPILHTRIISHDDAIVAKQ